MSPLHVNDPTSQAFLVAFSSFCQIQKLCTCLCWKGSSVLIPEVGAAELDSAWQSLFPMEDHDVLINSNKNKSEIIFQIESEAHATRDRSDQQRCVCCSQLPGSK